MFIIMQVLSVGAEGRKVLLWQQKVEKVYILYCKKQWNTFFDGKRGPVFNRIGEQPREKITNTG